MSPSSKPPADRAGRNVWRAATALAAALLSRPRALASNGNRNDGPPDLDELWRDFNRKLGGLFGGKGGGDARQRRERRRAELPARHEEHRHRRRPGAGVVVLIWLGSGFFIVQEGQQAVITAVRPLQAHRGRRLQLALAVSVPAPRDGGRHADPLGRGRPRHHGAGDRPARFVDADARTRTSSTSSSRCSTGSRTRAPTCSRAAIPTRRWCRRPRPRCARWSARAHGLGARPRSATPSPTTSCKSDAGAARPLKAGIVIANVNVQSVQPPEQVQAAFDDAFKAGQDRERAEERGPGLCQRRDPARRARPRA